MDDIKPYIEGFDWLSAKDKKVVFEDDARRVFKLPASFDSRGSG